MVDYMTAAGRRVYSQELAARLDSSQTGVARERRVADADKDRLSHELQAASDRAAAAEHELAATELHSVELRRLLRAKHDYGADLETARAEAHGAATELGDLARLLLPNTGWVHQAGTSLRAFATGGGDCELTLPLVHRGLATELAR